MDLWSCPLWVTDSPLCALVHADEQVVVVVHPISPPVTDSAPQLQQMENSLSTAVGEEMCGGGRGEGSVAALNGIIDIPVNLSA